MSGRNDYQSISQIKKHRQGIILIAGTLLLLFTLSGCIFFPKEEKILAPPLKEPPEVTYETIEIAKGLFENKIESVGYFISVNQKNFCFKNRGGRLKQVRVATGDIIKKGTLLAELLTDSLESQIKLQEIMVEKAQMAYDIMVASEESPYNIRRAKLDLTSEQLKLDDLGKELAESKLVSTVNGTVNYTTEAKEGDYVDAFRTIVRLADISNIQLECTGDKINYFKLGNKVGIAIDDQSFYGRVVMTPANMPLSTDEKTVPSVRIKVDVLPKTVKIGDSAYITLILIRKEEVIVIPKNLIHNYGARNYVHVLENGLQKERDIEIGTENQTEVIVTKGLEPGDQLIND